MRVRGAQGIVVAQGLLAPPYDTRVQEHVCHMCVLLQQHVSPTRVVLQIEHLACAWGERKACQWPEDSFPFL